MHALTQSVNLDGKFILDMAKRMPSQKIESKALDRSILSKIKELQPLELYIAWANSWATTMLSCMERPRRKDESVNDIGKDISDSISKSFGKNLVENNT